jgi:HEAT repeat protein
MTLALCQWTSANANQHKTPDVAISSLVERLGSEDSKIRKEASEALQMRSQKADAGMGGVTGLSGDDDDVAEMERFRKEAKPLVPALIKLLRSDHEESRVAVARALGAIGPDAEASRAALRRIIRDPNNSQGFRLVAAPALLRAMPRQVVAGREFLEDFVGACDVVPENARAPDQDKSPQQDDEAFAGWCGPYLAVLLILADRTSIEVPSLVEVMTVAFPKRLRLTAIAALATLEAEAASAVPSLQKLFDDKDAQIRQLAGSAVVRIQGDRAGIELIIKALSLDAQESANFLDEANDFIKRRKADSNSNRDNGRENVLLAVPMLRHHNSFHQRQAIRMLAEIGPVAKDAVPELTRLLKSEDMATRAAAEVALKRIAVAARLPDQ